MISYLVPPTADWTIVGSHTGRVGAIAGAACVCALQLRSAALAMDLSTPKAVYALLAVSAAFALAGCRDQSSSWRGEPHYSIDARDTKRAYRASLHLSDFPNGWTIQFAHGLASYFWPEISGCADFSELTVTGESYPSDEFTPGREVESARSYVTFFRTRTDARKALNELSKKRFDNCVANKLVKRTQNYPLNGILDFNANILSARVDAISIPAVADEGRGIQVNVIEPQRIGYAGTPVAECNPVVWIDYVFVRSGRIVAMLALRSVRQPSNTHPFSFGYSAVCKLDRFPDALKQELMRKVAGRIGRARVA